MSQRSRLVPGLLAAALVTAPLTGCSIHPETVRDYTPSHGVNAERGDVKVRNLVLLSDGSHATLYGAVVSAKEDSLGPVSVSAGDASSGTELRAEGEPVKLPAATLVKLPHGSAGAVAGKGLEPGRTVKVTMAFAQAGSLTLDVPVLDRNHPDYRDATPARPATPSASVGTPVTATTPTATSSRESTPSPGAPSTSAETTEPATPVPSPSTTS